MKEDYLIILGTAHRNREPGKCSPDKKFRECIYSREVVKEIATKLREYGCKVEIDYEDLDLSKEMQSSNISIERNRELKMRVNIVNTLCKQYGSKKVIYISLHNDAAGSDNKWHTASGWSVIVSPKASEGSKRLAKCLIAAAHDSKIKVREYSPKEKYWKQNLYVLNNTICPAVLTENLFQDNKDDVEFLLSEAGKHIIERIHIEGILKYINGEYI